MTPGGKLANAVGRLHQYHVAAIDARTGIDAPEADGRAGRGIPDEAWSGIDREVEHGGRAKQGEADDTGNQDHAAATRAPGEWRQRRPGHSDVLVLARQIGRAQV